MSGQRIERREVGRPGEFEALTDDELERALIERLARLGFSQTQQDQQPDTVKADAQKIVSIIKSDKAKNQIYCQIADLDERYRAEQALPTKCGKNIVVAWASKANAPRTTVSRSRSVISFSTTSPGLSQIA